LDSEEKAKKTSIECDGGKCKWKRALKRAYPATWHDPSFVIQLTVSLYIFAYELKSKATLYRMWRS